MTANSISAVVAPLVIGGEVAIVVALLIGLHLARPPLEPARSRHGRTTLILALVLAGWFALDVILARAGLFAAIPAGAGPLVPPIAFGIGLPLATGIAAVLVWRRLGDVLAAIPASWLVGVQVYRVLGAVFLYVHAGGGLPGVFALPAGIGDVLVGLAALPVAYALGRGAVGAGGLAIAWNIAGIADLVIAVTLGFFSSPGPLQMLAHDAPNLHISAYPLVLIPLFAVPLSLVLHAASLRALLSAAAPAGAAGRPSRRAGN